MSICAWRRERELMSDFTYLGLDDSAKAAMERFKGAADRIGQPASSGLAA
jgi:hypothetical protein